MANYPSEGALKAAKQLYAQKIGQHSQEEIDVAIERLLALRQQGQKEYQHLNIDLFLGLMRSKWRAHMSLNDPNHPDYEPPMLEDLTKKDENVKQGNKTFSKLKGLFK